MTYILYYTWTQVFRNLSISVQTNYRYILIALPNFDAKTFVMNTCIQ